MKRACEVGALGKTNRERNRCNGHVAGEQQLARLVNAIAMQVCGWGDSEFLAKTIGQVVGADSDMAGDLLAPERFGVVRMLQTPWLGAQAAASGRRAWGDAPVMCSIRLSVSSALKRPLLSTAATPRLQRSISVSVSDCAVITTTGISRVAWSA